MHSARMLVLSRTRTGRTVAIRSGCVTWCWYWVYEESSQHRQVSVVDWSTSPFHIVIARLAYQLSTCLRWNISVVSIFGPGSSIGPALAALVPASAPRIMHQECLCQIVWCRCSRLFFGRGPSCGTQSPSDLGLQANQNAAITGP